MEDNRRIRGPKTTRKLIKLVEEKYDRTELEDRKLFRKQCSVPISVIHVSKDWILYLVGETAAGSVLHRLEVAERKNRDWRAIRLASLKK